MKRILAILTLLFSTSAFAAPMLINDNYVGADNHGYGDVIGEVSKFGISSMLVDLVGSQLTVTINTPFGANGLGTFVSATSGSLVGPNKGIGYGDLFLSSTGWNPSGTAPYVTDDNSNGTNWDFGISLTDRWSTTKSTDIGATLYSLSGTNNQNAYLTEDFLSSATFRNGQEAAVDTRGSNTYVSALGNSAAFVATNTTLTFTLDISGTALQNASNIGLHWTMTCGNDTIEGGYNVPEPATILLMLLGVLCLSVAGFHRRKVVVASNTVD